MGAAFEELLQKMGVSSEALEQAHERQAERGGHLRDTLLALGVFSPEMFAKKVEQLLRVPYVNVAEQTIADAVLTLLPQDSAEKYLALPIELDAKHRRVIIAMADPTNMSSLDELKFVVGHSLIPQYSPEDELQEKIRQAYAALEKKQLAAAARPTQVGTSKSPMTIPVLELKTLLEADSPSSKVLGKFFVIAHAREARELYIRTTGDTGVLGFTVDGTAVEYLQVPRNLIPVFIQRMKRLLGVENSPLPVKGYFALAVRENKELDGSCLIASAFQGEDLLIKLRDRADVRTLQDLGIEAESLATLQECLHRSSGVIVVTGPARSGVTTSLYALLQTFNNPHSNVVSIEDPVECRIDGVMQGQIFPGAGLTEAHYLHELLWQRPDVVMMQQIFDASTLKMLLMMAASGTSILCGLQAVDAANAVVKLRLMSQPHAIADHVNCIISQRLVRKICESCKEQIHLAESYRGKLGLSAEDECYAGKGCDECKYTGYKGVIPIFEVMPMLPEIQQAVLQTRMLKEFREVMAANQIVSLRDAGMTKVKQGITTVQEVLKATMVN